MKRACFPYCLLMLANEIMGGYQRPTSVRYFCFSSRRQPPFRPTLAGAQYTSAFEGARATSARRDPCRIISGRGFDSRQTPGMPRKQRERILRGQLAGGEDVIALRRFVGL